MKLSLWPVIWMYSVQYLWTGTVSRWIISHGKYHMAIELTPVILMYNILYYSCYNLILSLYSYGTWAEVLVSAPCNLTYKPGLRKHLITYQTLFLVHLLTGVVMVQCFLH